MIDRLNKSCAQRRLKLADRQVSRKRDRERERDRGQKKEKKATLILFEWR